MCRGYVEKGNLQNGPEAVRERSETTAPTSTDDTMGHTCSMGFMSGELDGHSPSFNIRVPLHGLVQGGQHWLSHPFPADEARVLEHVMYGPF